MKIILNYKNLNLRAVKKRIAVLDSTLNCMPLGWEGNTLPHDTACTVSCASNFINVSAPVSLYAQNNNSFSSFELDRIG